MLEAEGESRINVTRSWGVAVLEMALVACGARPLAPERGEDIDGGTAGAGRASSRGQGSAPGAAGAGTPVAHLDGDACRDVVIGDYNSGLVFLNGSGCQP